jgi:GT2 family glycosyltransferase
MKKDLSIIIINFNTKELLRDCLSLIFKKTKGLNFEVVVVDNCSIDSSVVMIKEEFPQVKLIENKKNLGFAKANNQGSKIAQGEYLLFLNSDTLILNNALKHLVKYMKENSEIGLIAPQLLLKNKTLQPDAFGPEPTLWQLTYGRFLKTKRIDWLSGAALMIKKDLFKKIGGFDENFFMYYEDIDLSKIVRGIGYEIATCPEAKIIHLVGQSIKRNRQRKMLYYQSQSYFYKKHYGKCSYFLLNIIRFPYKLLKILK